MIQEKIPKVLLAGIGKGAREDLVKSIIDTFLESAADLLVIECSNQLLQSSKWRQDIVPDLEPSCLVGAAELSSLSVGMPTTRKRTFVTIVRKGRYVHTENNLLSVMENVCGEIRQFEMRDRCLSRQTAWNLLSESKKYRTMCFLFR